MPTISPQIPANQHKPSPSPIKPEVRTSYADVLRERFLAASRSEWLHGEARSGARTRPQCARDRQSARAHAGDAAPRSGRGRAPSRNSLGVLAVQRRKARRKFAASLKPKAMAMSSLVITVSRRYFTATWTSQLVDQLAKGCALMLELAPQCPGGGAQALGDRGQCRPVCDIDEKCRAHLACDAAAMCDVVEQFVAQGDDAL